MNGRCAWRRPARAAAGLALILTCAVPLLTDAAGAPPLELQITELRAASGKPYSVQYGQFVPGGSQYIDRDYTFNYIPEFLQGQTLIKTAGDDKHIPEDQPCLSFRVNRPVTVYVVYGDKLRMLPAWLREFTDTRWRVTRKDTNPANLKGSFTLFAKDFPAGRITLNGNLSKPMAEDAEFKRMKGGTFCMYSVVVAPAPIATAKPAPQGESITPGENLVVQGIPPVPAALAAEVKPYTESRSAVLLDWHPRERSILVRTRFAETAQLHRVLMPGGARTQLTFFREPVAEGFFEPVRGGCLVFSRDVGGGEFFQYYRYDLDDGRVTLLTDGSSRNTGARWSHDGRRLAYGSTRRNGRDVDLWVVEPREPKSTRLLAELDGGGWFALDWSPDGRKMLLCNRQSINKAELWVLEVSTGVKKRLAPKEPAAAVAYLAGRFSRDGRAVYATTDRDSEFQQLFEIALDTGEHRCLTRDIPWDVEEFEPSPDGRIIAVVINEEGQGTLRLLDPQSGRPLPLPAIPRGSVLGLNWHPSGRELGFTLVGAQSPGDAYSLDLSAGRVEQWTASETGGLDAKAFSSPEVIRWKSFDGRMISGLMYRPPARFTGRRPVVIDIHGGPEGQSRPGFLGPKNYWLNELGVTLIFPNVRGSAGYGKTFLQLDNGLLREGSYRDIGALLDWIAAQPRLDPDRIMVTGGSYGGFMTLAVAANYAAKIRCAVDVVGLSNMVSFLENTAEYRRDLRRAEYGDERDPKIREFLNRIAPNNNAHKITKPLLVVQGQNDPRVPASESEQIVATVRKNGSPVWYLLAKDAGLVFRKKPNADFQFYATVLFMRKYLLP